MTRLLSRGSSGSGVRGTGPAPGMIAPGPGVCILCGIRATPLYGVGGAELRCLWISPFALLSSSAGGHTSMRVSRWQCVVLAFVVMLAAPYAIWLSVAQAQSQTYETMGTANSILTQPMSGSVEPTAGDAGGGGLLNVRDVPRKDIILRLGAVGS